MTNNYFKIRCAHPLFVFFDDTSKESANDAWRQIERAITALGLDDYEKVSVWRLTRCDGPWDGVVRQQGWEQLSRRKVKQAA